MKVVTGNGEFQLGDTETTPTIGMTDFSRRVTDDFGVTTVVERGFSRRMSVKLGLPFDTVDAVQRRLSNLRAAPALWVADDRYVWLSLYGFYKDFDLDLASPPLSRCTLSIDGLAETGGVTDNGADPALGQASTLQLLQPTPVTDAMLVSSLVAENDAPEWVSGTGYAKGARVIRASTHRIYESLIVGNTGKTPEAEPAWWLDLGPTNRWAMFDQALGTATTRNGGVEVTLNGGSANAVSLIDLVGDTVQVRANGYDQTQAVRPGAMTFTGLPGSGQVIVTVSGAQATVGTLLIGRVVGLGLTEAAPTAGITDFSRKETDDFGAVTVVERGYLKRMTARALIRSDAVDVVADRLASVRARPSLWIGQSGVDAITVYGFVKDFEIEVGTAVSKLSLTVEGLTKAAPSVPAALTLVPRGPYDPAAIYAAGALVEDQGVTWRYINVTPTSGYAPPTLPTTSNAFWQVFSSVGMTPEQQAAFAKLVETLAAITSDNVIAAGGEKNQIIQLHQQVGNLSGRAHVASVGLIDTYAADPTASERSANDSAMAALNTFLNNLGPPNWNDVTGDTPVDGAESRRLFAEAFTTANALLAAVDAYVSSRTKGAIDRVNAIGSDNVLSAGSEKQTAVIDWNTLYQDLESLYGKYVALGSPSDLTGYVQDASARRAALGSYLGSLSPAWNLLSVDTPIVSADWSAKWQDAINYINVLRAQITGRKGDPGADAEAYSVSARGSSANTPSGYLHGLRKPGGGEMGAGGLTSGNENRSYTVCVRNGAGDWTVRSFDVFGGGQFEYAPGGPSANDAAGMASYLNSISEGRAVVVYTSDEPATNRLTGGLAEAMYRCGASAKTFGELRLRSAYTLVGLAGWGEGRGFETYRGAVDSDVNAYVQSNFTVVNGVPVSATAGADGLDGFILDTQVAFSQPVYSSGASKPSWAGGSAVIRLTKGGRRVTDGVSYSVYGASSIASLALSGDTFSFAGATADRGSFTVRATYDGQSYDRVVTVTKSYDGEAAFKGSTSFDTNAGAGVVTIGNSTTVIPSQRSVTLSAVANYDIPNASVQSYRGRLHLYWRNVTDGGSLQYLGYQDGSTATVTNSSNIPSEPEYVFTPGTVSASFSFIAPTGDKSLYFEARLERIAGNGSVRVGGSMKMEVSS